MDKKKTEENLKKSNKPSEEKIRERAEATLKKKFALAKAGDTHEYICAGFSRDLKQAIEIALSNLIRK